MRVTGRSMAMAVVVAGHAGLLYLLAQGMRPSMIDRPAEESVLIVEFFPSRPPQAEPELLPDEPDALPEPSPRPQRPRSPASSTMQAVFEAAPAASVAPEPARERIDPGDDPFSRPTPPGDEAGFGQRDIAQLPRSRRPEIAGGRPPDAVLPELRARRPIGVKEVVEAVAVLAGLGGPNAPVEAPCGGRVSGGFGTAESFSPAWHAQYGCSHRGQPGEYDGKVELPPGSVR